jgi:conjugative transfer signal peptidase TraF
VIRGLFTNPGASRARVAKRLGSLCLIILFGLFQLWGNLGLRINTSPSLPVGLYMTTADASSPFVEFCPPEPYARLAITRGYRDVGNCPDGAAPLLKPVIAEAGDSVEVSPRGLAVNGRLIPNTAAVRADTEGRLLAAWPSGRYQVQDGMTWVASSYHPRSFDSRYFGPIATWRIRDHVRAIVTGGK